MPVISSKGLTVSQSQSLVGRHSHEIFVAGQWRRSTADGGIEVHDPSREQAIGSVPAGGAGDVDLAVAAAAEALDAWSQTTRQERIAVLHRVLEQYEKRVDELAEVVSLEMGAPITLARNAQAPVGARHLKTAIKILEDFEFETDNGNTRIVLEPIGVCGLITPWNWPLNQIVCKVAPALAAGCTMVLKPSEIAPFNAILFSEIIEDADVPAGVFNLVHGRGPEAGAALAVHPKVDLMSFTGSTRGGISVAINAAPTVKRVTQELGGKSPNIILDDADLEQAVRDGVAGCYVNSGQSCNALTRMLVPAALAEEAGRLAAEHAATFKTGDPRDPETKLGPVVSETQFDRVQGLIQTGVKEGAQVLSGGPGRPVGLERGWYVRPTVFAGVNNDMAIARTEISAPYCRSSRTRTKTRRSGSPTTPSTAWRRRSRRATRNGPKNWPAGCGPGRSGSTLLPRRRVPRSEVTSSPVTDESRARSACTTTWRRKR